MNRELEIMGCLTQSFAQTQLKKEVSIKKKLKRSVKKYKEVSIIIKKFGLWEATDKIFWILRKMKNYLLLIARKKIWV